MIDDPINEIKTRLSVTDVLADYIQMKKAGVNLKAVCPFHSEKTPSFVISPAKQIWHCFGCGLGGDIFEFVKLIENVEFAQALKILADKAGIELKKPTVQDLQVTDKKNLLVDINTAAAAYFEKVLWESNAGKEALDYLKKRGLSDQTIKHWRLGFAPEDFHYLENYLSKKYQKQDIVEAGLIVKRDHNSALSAERSASRDEYFDRFRGRIMFPIINHMGDIVGFTGRILKEQDNTGKYVNSPETQVYNKSEVIYGFYQAKQNIRKENRALLVEGNMDVISCHQAGFIQTVASSGTAITAQQLRSMQRLCENLVFAFDSDAAGSNATRRALETALEMGFSVKIVDMGSAKDPDELIKKGIGIWQKAVDTAPHYAEFFINQLFKQYDPNSVDGKRQITKEMAPLIYRISDSVTKAHFVRKLALGINIAEQTIWDIINKVNLPKVQKLEQSPTIKKDRKTILEEELLGLTINLEDKSKLDNYDDLDFEEVNREMLRSIKSSEKLKLQDLKNKFPNLSTQFDLLSFTSQVGMEQDQLDPKQELNKINYELFKLVIKKKMELLTPLMAAAEASKDKVKLAELSSQFSALSNKLSENQ